MASPFGSAAAQAANPSSPPINITSPQSFGSSSLANQDARDADYSSNNYSKQNGSFLEDSRTTPTPPTDGLIAPASSLSDLSPFANAPPLAPSIASSLANSTVSSAIKSVGSDSRSQKSSPIGQSIASAVTSSETAEAAGTSAMAAAAAAATVPSTIQENRQTQQKILPAHPSPPFVNGHPPIGNGVVADNNHHRNNFAFNLSPVPEGKREGQTSGSTDASSSYFSSISHQEMQQEVLQHLFPPNRSNGSGGGGVGVNVTAPNGSSVGRLEPNLNGPFASPGVCLHPFGIQNSSSNGSALSSPPSSAAAVAAAGGGSSGAFSRLGEKPPSSSSSPFTMGGMQMSQEQLQKAVLQALHSGQSSALTQLGQGGSLGGAAAVQPQQHASAADRLMAYHLLQQHQQMQQQQQKIFPAMPAGVVNPPTPLHLQDAAIQALQQQSGQPQYQQQYSGMHSPPISSDSWGQLRGNRSYPPSSRSTPDRRSLDRPVFSASDGGGGVDNEGLDLLAPAARYSMSRDSSSSGVPGAGVSANALQRIGTVMAAAEQRENSGAALLHRVKQSTNNMPKVRALLNTGGKFTTDAHTGSLHYEGGEVRLVSLPEGCTFPQLLAVLAKTERAGLSSVTPTTAASSLKESPKSVTSNASKETSSTMLTRAATATAQALSAAAAAVSTLMAAQEAASAADGTSTAEADAESYTTYAMHVSRAHCLLRYQLPSDPSIFVDIVDNEDVQLMFEEIAELRAFGGLFSNGGRSSGGAPSSKLRLFVQWIAMPPGCPTDAGALGSLHLNTGSRNTTMEYIDSAEQFLSPRYSGSFIGIDNNTNSSGGEGSSSPGALTCGAEKYFSVAENRDALGIAPKNNESTSDSPRSDVNDYQQRSQQHVHIAHRSASELRLAAVRSDQLECIPASEVNLLELLGTGTFGDMYVGKWRECTVAVKCFNPSSVGLNYGSQAAWLDFLDDANRAAALRHPNLVEVYGIVLPGAQDQRSMKEEVQQRSESLVMALKAAGGVLGNADRYGGGLMMGPKMSGRRTSWDFGDISRSCTPTVAASLNGGNGNGSGRASATSSSPFCAGIQRLPGPCMSTPAMVMEYVSGKSLHSAIQRKDDAVAGVLARILYALDVSRGMVYLHHRGVSHFDLKSTNILLGWRNLRPAAKIAGYGLSTRKQSLRSYTPGVSLSQNVFPWVPPEVLRNPDKVSHKADVFSFGVVLWELWALCSPYEGMDMTKLVSLAVNTDEKVRPEVPPPGSPAEPAPGWKDLVQQCWNEDPDERLEFVEIEKRLAKMAKEVKLAQRKPEGSSEVVKKECGGGSAGGCGDNIVDKEGAAPVENAPVEGKQKERE